MLRKKINHMIRRSEWKKGGAAFIGGQERPLRGGYLGQDKCRRGREGSRVACEVRERARSRSQRMVL